MKTTIGQAMKGVLYVFVYGEEGVGKTRLVTTLSRRKDGMDLAFITPEESGPTSIVSAGFSPNIPMWVLPMGTNPFEEAAAAITEATRIKGLTALCVDGITTMFGQAIDLFSEGQGEKELGWGGWGQILNEARKLEFACRAAKAKGLSIVMTAWDREPQYEEAAFASAPILKEKGRPLIQGQAKKWLPGNVDIVARMTASFVKEPDPKTKKLVKRWKGELQVNASKEWLAKSRWRLPDPCPADLGWILNQVKTQKALVVGDVGAAANAE